MSQRADFVLGAALSALFAIAVSVTLWELALLGCAMYVADK